LEYEANLIEPQPAQIGLEPAVIIDDLAVERDASGTRLEDAGDAVEQSRFAGTARAHEPDNLARIDFHVHVNKGVNPSGASAEVLGKMFDPHNRLSACLGHCLTLTMPGLQRDRP